MEKNLSEMLWNERFRPKTIEECILPLPLKSTFQNFILAGQCPNIMIHSSSGGTGKTTVLRALCNELDLEYLFVNASEQRSLDIIRNDVTQFVSTMSLDGRRKAVIFDECDSQTQLAQQALRSFIEQYSHIRFFFSCNFVDKIIQPLQSRCTVVSFDWPSEDHKILKNHFYTRIKKILTEECIEFKKEIVVELIRRFFPDFRRIINELQKHSITGKIDEGILVYSKEFDFSELLSILKNKKFTDLRKWVELNETLNYELFYRNFYKELSEFVSPACLPTLILILGKYMFQHSQVYDKQINLLCCLIEIMSEIIVK